jgi:hypothetical protein
MNQYSNIKLKTYVMLFAATAMNAIAVLYTNIKDIYFDNSVVLYVKVENTKTKVDGTYF